MTMRPRAGPDGPELKLGAYACICIFCLVVGIAAPASAQDFTSRGFADVRVFVYPQDAENDSTNLVGETLLRYEPAWKAASWLRVNASFDARIDTHDQVERRWFVDWRDRTIQRPPFSVRRLGASVSRRRLDVEIGKQFIRWGKADVLNPTDRFAPRDFLSVVDNDFLGVTGARATYEAGGHTVDAVWVPHFTPSRIPLFNQRWAPGLGFAGSVPAGVRVIDAGSRFPAGSQLGVRWNRSGSGYEFSLSFYNGYNHLPLISVAALPATYVPGAPGIVPLPAVQLTRFYPQMRMYGGDFALPNRWVTLKGEVGYFTSSTAAADEYGIYVLQLERQAGEWTLVGGYAGDFVTRTGVMAGHELKLGAYTIPFVADRGLARAFLGRATLSVDVNDSLAVQVAARRNGHGTWLQAQYSRAYGGHLRAMLEGNVIRGRDDDFLGQYHRNSNVNLALRYSF